MRMLVVLIMIDFVILLLIRLIALSMPLVTMIIGMDLDLGILIGGLVVLMVLVVLGPLRLLLGDLRLLLGPLRLLGDLRLLLPLRLLLVGSMMLLRNLIRFEVLRGVASLVHVHRLLLVGLAVLVLPQTLS